MEIKFSDNKIEFNKELNVLDKLTIKFKTYLDKYNIKYVLVSGYIAILFGRSRNSEDIDIIIEKLDFDKFKKLFEELTTEFYCINTDNVKEAYEEYITQKLSLRFSVKGVYIPNVEIKFPFTQLDYVALNERKEIVINDNIILFTALIELQIPFKIFLGSEKDIEDAQHLFYIFKGNIDENLMHEFARKLKIEGELNSKIYGSA